MKKLYIKLFLVLFVLSALLINAFAQAPEGIIYQAEARDDRGKIIANSDLDVKITILEDNENGNIVWEGFHNVRTNEYGMFVLVIGEGTSSYYFEDIAWVEHLHFLNVGVKKPKKTDYIDMGTTQLLSVPYALHAKSAMNSVNDEVDDADADPDNELITGADLNGNVLEITDAGGTKTVDLSSFSSTWTQNGSNIYYNSGNVGIGTDNPEGILNVAGGNVRIGKLTDDNGSTPSYGDRLYFSGGDDWPDWDSDNSDQLWMARYNADDNVSELRVGIGDDNWGDDKFVIGREEYDGTGWAPLMSVLGTGNVGIGTTNPSFNFEVVMDQGIATIAATTYRIDQFGAGQFIGQAARGTKQAPSAVQENDFLASFNGRGYGDSGFSDRPRGRLGFVAAENWTDANQGTYLILATTPIGTIENMERFRITSEGNIGIGTATPDERLHVAGNIKLDGTFRDKFGNEGSVGQILSSTETGTEWIAASSSDFSIGGEAGGADRTLGNTDDYALGFKTNNTTRLNIFNNGGIRIDGNVGINTDPDDISNINKSIKLFAQGTYSNPNINISGHNSANIYLESRRQGFTSETSGKKWYISSGSGSVLDLDKFTINNTDDGNCFTIRNGGYVGIGTQSPDEKLHIAGNMRLDGTFKDKHGNAGSAGQILSSTETGTEWILAPGGTDDADWTLSGNDIYSAPSGNVGIGTTNPARKLEVVAGSDNPQIRLTRMDNNSLFTEFKVDPSGNLNINPAGGGGMGAVYLDDDEIHMWKEGSVMMNRFSVSGNSYLNGGNVGIGTTNPHGKFEVFGKNPDGNTTVGDFVVDTENKKVYVGRLSSTSYDNSDFIIRNRLGHETFVFSGNGNYISLGNYNGSNEQMRVVFDGNTFGVGIGTTTPKSKLQVNGGVQIANDGSAPTADKTGTLRYRADSNNSYMEMCMQTGASTYEWVIVKQQSW